jgi:hypothetical protein
VSDLFLLDAVLELVPLGVEIEVLSSCRRIEVDGSCDLVEIEGIEGGFPGIGIEVREGKGEMVERRRVKRACPEMVLA